MPDADPPRDAVPPQGPFQLRCAGYRLVRQLGQGAVGSVHLALSPDGVGYVALKRVPLPEGADGEAARAGFLRSTEAARRLHHTDIVELYNAGVEGAIGWLAMEVVPGGDLARYTQPARLLPEALVLRIGARLARALAHAHRQGVVHRDLKPANVLVDWAGDNVKLADFGLARIDDGQRTATGVVPGSPAYMAPELLAGGLPTPRSDFYALGAMLFQLLSGRLPFESASMGELLRRVAEEPPPDLQALHAGCPAALAALLAELLAKSPAARPGDGDALALRLEALAAVMQGST